MPFFPVSSDFLDLVLFEPTVTSDEHGFSFESFTAHEFRQASSYETYFVQDNHSWSGRNVLRGLHYQILRPQGKLVRVLQGFVYDVAVDLRRSSPNLGIDWPIETIPHMAARMRLASL